MYVDGEPEAAGLEVAVTVIRTEDNKNLNQDDGNGWEKRERAKKYLESKSEKLVSDWIWMVREKEASGISPIFLTGWLGS